MDEVYVDGDGAALRGEDEDVEGDSPNWVNCVSVRCGDTYHDRHTDDGAIGG